MIERADFDQDGLVSEEEFYNLLTKKAFWAQTWSEKTLIEKIQSFFLCLTILNLLNAWIEYEVDDK
jgi:hypothetical protein